MLVQNFTTILYQFFRCIFLPSHPVSPCKQLMKIAFFSLIIFAVFSTPLALSLASFLYPPFFSTYPVEACSTPTRECLNSTITYALSDCIYVLCNRPIPEHPATHPAPPCPQFPPGHLDPTHCTAFGKSQKR